MKNPNIFLFFVPTLIISLYLILFTKTSLKEKEFRAAIISAILFVMFFTFSTFIFLQKNLFFLYILDGIYLVAFFILFFPFRKEKHKLQSPTKRYDERDIMFARARYVAGSVAYQDYYSRFPERKKSDDLIRSMPDLLSPGGKHYQPIEAKIADTYFSINEKLIPLAEGNPAAKQTSVFPENISLQIKKMIKSLGAVDVGIAKLNPNIVYSMTGRGPGGYGTKISLDHSHIIVFAVEMDFEAMRAAPKINVVVESSKQYLEAAKISIAVASFIRSLGYEARAHMDMNYRVILPPAAVAAGLGEMGRIGIFMHKIYGPRVRLGAVSTTIPLVTDNPVNFDSEKFCQKCKKCASNCPSGAISYSDPKEVNGVVKWSTNQQACYKYWREVGTDCGICMKVCPYSQPHTFVHNVLRLMVKNSPIGRRVALLGDKLFYGKFPVHP